MKRSLIHLAAACSSVLLAAAASSTAANAYYLGYGNGDPGNWDFWTEQNGGINPETQAEARAVYVPRAYEMHHAPHAHYAHHRHRRHDSFESGKVY